MPRRCAAMLELLMMVPPRAPSATKRRTAASPMPLVPPVMTATFPSSLPGIRAPPLLRNEAAEYHYLLNARKALADAAAATPEIFAPSQESAGLWAAVCRNESMRLFHIVDQFWAKC